jgi:intracellular septation protein A
MKIASIPDRIFLRIAGKFTLIITNAEAIKIKQTALIIFIGIHCGWMLLSRVILNSHPVRSRMLKANTIITDIQTAVWNEPCRFNEYQCGFEI